MNLQRQGGAYTSGRPSRHSLLHTYADCGFIREALFEVPYYTNDGGHGPFIYSDLNSVGEPMVDMGAAWDGHIVNAKMCGSCDRRAQREAARKERT